MKRVQSAGGYRVEGLGKRLGNRLDGAGSASYGSRRVVRKVGVGMNGSLTKFFVMAPLVLGLAAAAPAKSRNFSTLQGQSQDSSQPPANSQTQGQTQNPPQDDSVTAAAKKAKEKKDKPTAKKVYSEDDIARLPGPGVSVIGQQPAAASEKEKIKSGGGKGDADPGEKEEVKDEAYWRKRARKILDQMDALDDQIQRARDDAKKTKPTQASSSDSSNGDQQNAEVQVDDRKSRLQDLEKQKAELQKQLDSLQEEGRRAGAPAFWFR
jgi:hypothetical protein